MRLGSTGSKLLIVVLYFLAMSLRTSNPNIDLYPYYNGESATNFRNVMLIKNDTRLPLIDDRSLWPRGYEPAASKASGVEHFTGYSYKISSIFSNVPPKRFVALWVGIIFALSVITFFGMARALWQCRAAGLIAATLVAFSYPVIAVSNGQEFLHAPFALLLISVHLWAFYAYARRPDSRAPLIFMALAAMMLLGAWASAVYYVALFVLLAPYAVRTDGTARRIQLATAIAFVVAGLFFANLRATRVLVSWPAMLILASVVVAFIRQSLPRRLPAIAYVAIGFVPLALFVAPLQSGATHLLSTPQYWLYRLRFVFGKPDDPAALPESVRLLWDHAHSAPSSYAVFALLLPIALLMPLAVIVFNSQRGKNPVRSWVPALLAGAGLACFVLDRSAVLFAALGLFPFVAIVGRGFRAAIARRIAPVGIALLLVVLQGVGGFRAINPTFSVATWLNMSLLGEGFVWASVGNADRDAVRFLVSRTSVRDNLLMPPRFSSLGVAFAGRKGTIVPGVYTVDATRRLLTANQLLFGSEQRLYAFCDSLDVTYLLYSINTLLDDSKSSPRYLAGLTTVPERSVAFDMHFRPQQLDHFNMVYENDNYRLFKVTSQHEPMFITDHPPVYQYAILERHHDTLVSFYERVVDMLFRYTQAVISQNTGDEQGAIMQLRFIVDKAPRYSDAWLTLGDSHARERDYTSALRSYRQVLNYAPDNAHALYFSALMLAHLERDEEALNILVILLATGGPRDLIQRADTLRRALEAGAPIVSPDPPGRGP